MRLYQLTKVAVYLNKRPAIPKDIKAILQDFNTSKDTKLLFYVRGNLWGVSSDLQEILADKLNNVIHIQAELIPSARLFKEAQKIKDKINTFDRTYKVLSLGAGVQSSVMLLMADQGLLGDMPDFAVFADTRDEPDDVYKWLRFLYSEIKHIPIYIASRGSLIGDYLDSFVPNQNGEFDKRASSIPWYSHNGTVNEGKLIRQCTVDYKIDVVWKEFRDRLGYKRKEPFKNKVEMWIGISTDEYLRAKESREKYMVNKHPLLDMNMSRANCLEWLKQKGYEQAPKSSCIYCPYHSDRAWQEMKTNRPEDFESACQIDEAIRINPRLKSESYIHRSCVPLRDVEFKPKEGEFDDTDHFVNECFGMCGV